MTAIVIRLVAHATEYDADQAACEMATRLSDGLPEGLAAVVPSTTADAAKVLAYGLILVSGNDDAARRAGWMHPSLIDRVRRLQQIGDGSPADGVQDRVLLRSTYTSRG
ncbi:MAG: hypothetical protein R3C05_07045 [Pirellulaceae bacterium]